MWPLSRTEQALVSIVSSNLGGFDLIVTGVVSEFFVVELERDVGSESAVVLAVERDLSWDDVGGEGLSELAHEEEEEKSDSDPEWYAKPAGALEARKDSTPVE
jgi:hypothetical protein